MKRNLILLISMFVLGCIPVWIVKAGDVSAIIPKVFKVYAYSYNSSFGNYKAEGFGSAVLVDTNKVLTNAHVIMDNNGGTKRFYELCKSNGLKEKTTCFSALKLISYDEEHDLALLEVVEDSDLGTPVTLGTSELTIGTNINVVGFPENGGDSVTVTKGTIAGYEEGFYKIDANLDGGNSGGGGFDDNGNLIGIPTFVSEGYTTLGYIIPIDIVKKFLAGESGKKVTTPLSSTFLSYLDTIYAFQSGGKISNANFTTPDIKDYGFQLKYIGVKKDKGFYDYDLSTADESVWVSLRTLQFSSKMSAREYANFELYTMRKRGVNTSIINKKVNNVQWFVIYNAETKTYSYIQGNSRNNISLVATVQDTTEEGAAKTDLKNAVEFIENISFQLSSQKNKAIPLPQIGLSGTSNFLFVKSYGANGMSVSFYPANKRFIGMLNYFSLDLSQEDIKTAKEGLTTIESYWKSLYKSAGYTVKNSGVIKTNQGVDILQMQLGDENNNDILLAHMIIKDAGNYLMPIIEFHYYSAKDLNYIKNYIKSITISSPIK